MQIPVEYILIKDKDGIFKYFKDGQLFSVEEIEKKFQKEESSGQMVNPPKVKLKPVQRHPLDLPITKLQKSEKKINNHGEKKYSKKKLEPIIVSDNDILDKLPVDNFLQEKRKEDRQKIEESVNFVIDKLKVHFSDPETAKNFNKILATYFRGIRTEKELAYVFSLPKGSGGMEIPKEKVPLVLTVVREALEHLQKGRKVFSFQEQQYRKPQTETLKLSPPPPNISLLESYDRYVKKTPSKIQSLSVNKNVPQPKVDITNSDQKSVYSPRPRVDGFSVVNKLVGPVEELALMDVDNLRKLGNDSRLVYEKIINKFEILGSQGLVKKMAGIEAWKSSPIFKIYVDMTMQGMYEKKTIAEVIKFRQIKNLPVLMLSEYELIGWINRTVIK